VYRPSIVNIVAVADPVAAVDGRGVPRRPYVENLAPLAVWAVLVN